MASASSQTLTEKRCIPCEQDSGGLGFMGLCESFSMDEAQEMLPKVEGWNIHSDEAKRLRIRKSYKTKNFVKALELCNKIGEVAEAEGHHPDLHITGWNNLMVEIWTHARDGLTENDFILAAKIDSIPKEDLLRKPKKKLADA
jgi:4a-hydroxytetrahydrobiopterin dehydratase